MRYTLLSLLTVLLFVLSAPLPSQTGRTMDRRDDFIDRADEYIASVNGDLTPERRGEIAKAVAKYSAMYGVDPYKILAIISIESAGFLNTTSPAGARGYMQLMPHTAWHLARELGILDEYKIYTRGQMYARLYDIDLNIRLGTYYMSKLLKQFDGDWDRARLAYLVGDTLVSYYLDAIDREYESIAREPIGGKIR
ncbi:MAG: transglycosylase SLT domain-containing protein [bacterium]